MVDESLLAYFSTQLEQTLTGKAGYTPNDGVQPAFPVAVTDNLRTLLSYNNLTNPFNATETTQLIHAIDNCKILDPACGSGAFPMGILHKLVHVLQKLDPKNQRWKERQIDKAQLIDDVSIREQLIDDIETAFNANEFDYGRKLYLIENCIYGVDIQAIAVQISKLRFFISLIVDQKSERKKENFGVRPLPNLETKFVAANTLIGIDKPKVGINADSTLSLFDSPDVEALEKQLKEVRHRLFSAKTPATKRKLRDDDKTLREQIGALLQEHGWGNVSAQQLAHWNPYDQNASADFFDVEWMFGLDGFDIVIGNPPYIQIQKFSGQQCQLDWQNQKYQTFAKTGDIYALFIEKGVSLLNKNGLLTFITSNKWMRAGYGKALRVFLAEKTQPLKLIDFGGYQVFESATVDSNILITQNVGADCIRPLHPTVSRDRADAVRADAIRPYVFNACTIQNDFTIATPLADYFAAHSQKMPQMSADAWVISSNIEQHIKAKIEAKGTPLKDWDVSIYRGIQTGFNEAFIIDTPTKERLCLEDVKSSEIIKPVLRGRDIKRYAAKWAGLWIIFIPWHFPLHEDKNITGASKEAEEEFEKQYPAIYRHITKSKMELSARDKTEIGIRYEWYALTRCASTYYKELEKEKIIYPETTQRANFFLDTSGEFFIEKTTFILLGSYLTYIVSVLSSSFGEFVYKNYYAGAELGKAGYQYNKHSLEKFPIPKLTASDQQPFIELVEKILAAKKAGQDTSAWEAEIDTLVYGLYGLTDEEIAIVEGGK